MWCGDKMPPMNGKKSKGGVSQKTSTHRLVLVRQGKASWLPIRLMSVEDACRKAGLEVNSE